MWDDALSAVAAAVGLREGRHGVEQVLRHLSGQGHTTTRMLSRLTGLPVPLVAAVRAELRRAGLVAGGQPARLSPAGLELVELLGCTPGAGCACPACGGLGIAPPARLDEVGRHLAAVLREAPRADPRLDQVHCTVESKLRRFAYLLEAGALGGKSVLLLGDDDFLALALPLAARALGSTPPRRLTVVDVDPGVLDFSRTASRQLGIEVELVAHDLRRPLPAGLTGAFDTVFTDPPYTLGGAELFLSRAAGALRQGPGRQVFLCFGARPPDDIAVLQRAVTGMGFAIHHVVRNFNDYLGAGVLGGASHLYHLVSGTVLTPSVAGDFEAALYTGEAVRPGRSYSCGGCGARLVVGPGARWATIQDLRREGCPSCQGTVFRPGRRASRPRAR